MTLSRKIADAVNPRPGQADLPCTIEVADGPARLVLKVTELGTVGIAFESLELHADLDSFPLSAPDLRAWGGRLAARLTYLMEPLVVLEVDVEAGEAELRSRTPTPRGEIHSFYEVRLRAEGCLRFSRIGWNSMSRTRQVLPSCLTTEALERMVDDLVATLP